MEPSMPSALNDCGLPVPRSPIMDVERLAQRTASRSLDVRIARSGPQVIIGVVRIRYVGPFEIGRQHAANEFYVAYPIVRWRVGSVEQAVVCNRDALGAATMSDPGDAAGVDMSH